MSHEPSDRPDRRPSRSIRPPARQGAGALGLAVLLAAVAASCSIGTEDDGSSAGGSTSTTEASSDDTRPDDSSEDEGGRGGEQPSEGSEETEEPEGALLLVMDASGSMNETDAGGRPRIEAAKEALHAVVDSMPDGLHAGLRVFGHRYPNTDRANGCRDSELIAPVEPLDREALNTAIDGYQARGFTPIGLSLQEAANDLPPEGPRTVVLVTDGEDTCGSPDPCQVAEELRAGGTEVVLHTVGVALGDNQVARDQLSCVAQAGGGEFFDVEEVGDLASALEDVTERESRRFETAGLTLEGAPVPRDANTGTVGTAHVDTVVAEETNYYRFEIEPGSEVQAELILAPNPDLASDSSRTCSASVALADSSTDHVGDFDVQYGMVTDAVVAETPPTVVDDDEVFLEVKADCSNYAEPGISYDIELRLSVVD